jgi:hypothetical protein
MALLEPARHVLLLGMNRMTASCFNPPQRLEAIIVRRVVRGKTPQERRIT